MSGPLAGLARAMGTGAVSIGIQEFSNDWNPWNTWSSCSDLTRRDA